jgi:hypothetical protein
VGLPGNYDWTERRSVQHGREFKWSSWSSFIHHINEGTTRNPKWKDSSSRSSNILATCSLCSISSSLHTLQESVQDHPTVSHVFLHSPLWAYFVCWWTFVSFTTFLCLVSVQLSSLHSQDAIFLVCSFLFWPSFDVWEKTFGVYFILGFVCFASRIKKILIFVLEIHPTCWQWKWIRIYHQFQHWSFAKRQNRRKWLGFARQQYVSETPRACVSLTVQEPKCHWPWRNYKSSSALSGLEK